MRTSDSIPEPAAAQPGVSDLLAAIYGDLPPQDRHRWQATTAHKPSPKSGYGFVECLLQSVAAHVPISLIEALEAPHRHGGNRGYPVLSMFRAYVLHFALNEPYANGFLNRLGADGHLLAMCGLDRGPSERAYSEFKKKLVPHIDLIKRIIADVFLECADEIERLREAGIVPKEIPPLGYSLVMDSTDIEAWARPARKERKTGETKPSKDADAQWGHRTAKNHRSTTSSEGTGSRNIQSQDQKNDDAKGKDGKNKRKEAEDELFFGYSSNIIVDANYGLPLYSTVRPANASDTTVLVRDLDDCMALYSWLRPMYFLADKGYDSLENLMHLVSLGMIPVVAVRLPPKDKETGRRLYDGIYDGKGRPTCIGGLAMEYVATDPGEGHLFRCPPGGCHLKDKVAFSGYCDSQHYEMPEGKLLRIVGLLPRCSEEWKTLYKQRPIIERYNSSSKHSRLLDTHRYFNIEKVALHDAMSMLSYLATALAHLKADDYDHMRHMRINLPKAPKSKPPEQPLDPCIAAAVLLHEYKQVLQAA